MPLLRLRLIRLTIWGLAAAVALLAASLFDEPGQQPSLIAPQVETASRAKPEAGEAGPPSFQRFEPLLQGSLFGQAQEREQKEVETATESADLPSLEGFKLVGVMAGSQNLSWAVIEETGARRQEMVGLGDRIGQGEVLSITADRVVVQVKGQRLQLVMEDRTDQQMDGVLTIKAEAQPEAEQTAAAPPPDRPEQVPDRGPIRLQPAGPSGQGVVVVSPGAVGAGLGLKAGDTIQARNPAEVQLYLDELSDGRAVSMELEREGRRLGVFFSPL